MVVGGSACGDAAPPREGEPGAADTAPAAGDPRTPSPDARPAPGQQAEPERAEPGFAGELRAFGTEPFWGVTVGGDSIRLMDMATGDTISWPAPEPADAEGRPPELARAWLIDRPEPVVLMVRRAPEGCSDGMSDNLYPWFALFLRGDRLYEGCARADTSASRASAPGAEADTSVTP